MEASPDSNGTKCPTKEEICDASKISKAEDYNHPGGVEEKVVPSPNHESEVIAEHSKTSGAESMDIVENESNSKRETRDIDPSEKGDKMPDSESSDTFDGLGTLALACAKMEAIKNKKAGLKHPIAISSKSKRGKNANQILVPNSSILQPSMVSRKVSDSSGDVRQEVSSLQLLNEVVECSGSERKYITANDVLCGRGGLTNHHPGNVFFRRLVRLRQESYLRACKRDKAGVAHTIVWTIRKLDPPGRFLKRKKLGKNNTGIWVEIGDRKAREKTSQALRERAPELMDKLMSSTLSSQVKDLAQTCAPSIPEKARFLGLWEQNQKEGINDKTGQGNAKNEKLNQEPNDILSPSFIVKETEVHGSHEEETSLRAPNLSSVQDAHGLPDVEPGLDQGNNLFCPV